MNKPLTAMTLAELWQLFPIQLTPHNPLWRERYRQEARLLRHYLPQENIQLHHIGSTAIPGIDAKPIIDILLETADGAALRRIADALIRHGYLPMSASDSRISLNKGYTPRGFAKKVFHIHLRLPQDNDELYFRDYLREHPDIAQAYQTLKHALAAPYKHDRDGYTAAKGDFIRQYTQAAKALYHAHYASPSLRTDPVRHTP